MLLYLIIPISLGWGWHEQKPELPGFIGWSEGYGERVDWNSI
jgi:hypothetical protein